MICARKINNLCTKYNTHCNIEPETMCAQYVEKEPVKYCKYCFNARIYKPTEEELMNPFNTELTDENDYSSWSVGKSSIVSKDRRFMISSGWGKPVRIEFDEWVPGLNQWTTVGVYYPKCCPECGRRLDEYEVPEVHP